VDRQGDETEISGGPSTSRKWWRELALIAALAMTLNLAGNGKTSLWDRDEPRYAGCTREMRESGDLLFPTFNAEPRYHKPILIYWLMLAGTALGGDNPFGARLVSAFAGTATVCVVWLFGRRLFGAGAARWAALVFATAPIVVAESKLATTDATLLLFLTMTQVAIWRLSEEYSPRWVAAFWAFLGLAVLTKGPAGPALLVAASAASVLLGGPRAGYLRLFGPLVPARPGPVERESLRLAWGHPGWTRVPRAVVQGMAILSRGAGRWLAANWGPILFAAIVAPWFVVIGFRSGGTFYDVAFGYHVVKRVTSSIETHGGFPGYYVALTLALFYPWSAFLPAGLAAAWKQRKEQPQVAFLLGWIIGPLVLLEIVRTKLIHYYLPAYPACALLVAWLIPQVARSGINLRRWPMGRFSVGLLGGIGLAYAVALFAGVFAFPGELRWHCLPLAIVIGVGTIYALERIRAGHMHRGAASLVAVWSLALFLFGGWMLPEVQPYRLSPMVARKLDEMDREGSARPILAAFKPPGVVWEIGHPLPVAGDRKSILEQIRRDGAIAAAFTPEEMARLDEFPEFEVARRDSPLTGFNVETFRVETLHPVILRERPSAVARGGGEASLVE
jgi:4-amino-4-deoxy-L-arabinose transferase-like glycosyltransferase